MLGCGPRSTHIAGLCAPSFIRVCSPTGCGVQVADFGLAAVVNSDSLACSKVGTPLYMAPEQIQGAGYTAKSDMWALGCIIYEVRAVMLVACVGLLRLAEVTCVRADGGVEATFRCQ
jgi:hypothetical protein